MDVVQVAQEILEKLLALAGKDVSALLALFLVLYAATGFIRLIGSMLRSAAKSIGASLPFTRRESVPVVDPMQQRWIALQEDNTSIIKDLVDARTQGVENERLLIARQDKADLRMDSLEAMIARKAGEDVKTQRLLEGLAEHNRTLSAAIEALINRSVESETKVEAQDSRSQAVLAVNAHTDAAVRPVLEHAVAQAVTIGTLDGKLDAHRTLIEGMPDALVIKVKETMPPIVQEAFAVLIAERDAQASRAVQAEVARDGFKAQAEALAKDLAAANETIRIQNATIAALPRPFADVQDKPEPAPLQSGEVKPAATPEAT